MKKRWQKFKRTYHERSILQLRSFSTLEEKGFDEECTHYYTYEGDELVEYTNGVYSRNSKDCHRCTSPTHQMAMAWLREEHHIFVEIGISIDLNGDYHYRYSILNRECKYVRKEYPSFSLNYKEAVEAALKYVLENLI